MKRFNKDRIKSLLDTTAFGENLIHLTSIKSTNDHASEMIDNIGTSELGDINGTLILADEQTGGRGRFNRKWLSPPGGLWFSLIFDTDLRIEELPTITLIAAFSAADVLMRFYDINVNIKWPNDLYFQGHKLGGILSESKDTGPSRVVILGMGLNIDIEKKLWIILRIKL